jgi:hypothetical protein
MRRLPALIAPLFVVALVLSGCSKSSTTAASPTTTGATASTSTATTGSGSATPSDTSCPTSNTVAFAKTKFVTHVGLAAGTFHRWLYKPYKDGKFQKGAGGRTLALVKAGATALFDVHEVKKAVDDVKANPTLCKVLVKPLGTLSDKMQAVYNKIKGGDTSGLDDAETAVTAVTGLSATGGVPITESTDESKG